MNANELADELKLVRCLAGDGQALDRASTMLRQLQAENEALKANFNKENPVKEVFNKPVAYLHTDGSLIKVDPRVEIIDPDFIPLYTHPVKEFNDGGEPVKNATYWKRQYNLMSAQCDNLKSGLYHANEQIKYLEAHPVKELTDKEIGNIFAKHTKIAGTYDVKDIIFPFAKAILKRAQEK